MTAVGERTPRLDGPEKVQGSAVYTVDVTLPGTLTGMILRSPIARGTIRRLEVDKARQTPGVWALITGEEAPKHRSGLAIKDQLLFATERIHYEGEPIAAVAAETREAALEALESIELEIDAETPVIDLDEAVKQDSPLVHPDWETFEPVGEDFPRGGNVCGEMVSDPEGVDEALANAHMIIENEYRAGRQYQAYLEPRGVVAEYESGRYILNVSHQFPFNVRDRMAAALGVRPSKIRVVGHHIGGGFGAKLDLGIEPHAALLARASGRPVKLINGRTEDMITCQCREDAIVRIKSAVDSDGHILARDMDVLLNSGAAGTDGPYLASIPLILAGAGYRVGPTRVRARTVYTNTAPTGAFRGVSGTHLVFAIERHMDEIANELGIDRRELRLRNLQDDGDTLLNGQQLPDASILREAYDQVEAKAPWSEAGKGPYRGVGIATCVWLTNPLSGSVVLKMNEDGTLGVVTGATENGSGAVAMGVAQIAAEELGLSARDVVMSMPDTDNSPYDAGSQGSRTTHIVGRAVGEAATELREQIYRTAARLLEASPADIELIGDGKVAVKGSPSSELSLAEVASEATASGETLTATGSYATPQPKYDPTCATGLLFPVFPTPTYHVHQAEVEVDPVTGKVTILRYVVAQEVGKVINPDGIIGQIQGGVAQGIGYTLYERIQIGEDGRYKQRTLETYRLPVAQDVPDVEAILLEHPDSAGPFGAKGVAEPPVVPVAAAIGNAIADAIGAPVNSLPILPEDVLAAMDQVHVDVQ
jgi:CO/xanthine dehydrogenase Mo-binding subunit